MSELVKEIERQLDYDMIEEGNMTAYDVLEIVKNFKQLELDDNQKIVLDWLKWRAAAYSESVATIIYFLSNQYPFSFEDDDGCGHANAKRAYAKLNRKQQFEVLAAFAQWGLEQEEES